MSTKCEGQRRYGGVFTFGKPEWVQCTEDAIVVLTIDGEDIPACNTCWKEVIENKLDFTDVKPIPEG